MRSSATFTPRHVAPSLREPAVVLMDLQDALTALTGKTYCVLCSSGSAALYMAIRAHGVYNLGVPASTFPAIREACELARVQAQFVDTDPLTWHSDLAEYAAVAPVHNFGCVSHKRYSPEAHAAVIIDAAAALLTPNAFVGKGTYCVSFNWNKSVSGGGGGCVLTDACSLADTIEGLKRHRGAGAFNFQMPANVASEVYNQLATADARRDHIRNLSLAYDLELAQVGLGSYPRGTHRWLTGTMLRDEAAVTTAQRKLSSMGYAPRRAWTPLGPRDTCPGAWEIYDRGLVLPGGYDISADDVRAICAALEEFSMLGLDDLGCMV